MAGKITWRPKAALFSIRNRLVKATEIASAEGADRAREIAPVGKGARQATGSNPRFFATRLQTTYEFNRQHRNSSRRARAAASERLVRLKELRSLKRSELVNEVRSSDIEFFRFSSGSNKGEQPDYLDVRPAKGPGGEAVKGAVTTYRPGRLRRGIHPIEVQIKGLIVTGGFASDAPYSKYVEHGFHHKGGTEVEGKHFMRKSTEALRERWNSGEFIKE
jgi:hypothetical protein